MVKMSGEYQGQKHSEVQHGPSGAIIHTDAPKDNNGKGEAFSPTDLLGAAMGSCMMTVMAITADKDGVELKGSRFHVEKEMGTNPRRIVKLNVNLHLPKDLPADYRAKLEQVALTCPVKQSVHPDMEIPVSFHYDI